MLHMAESGKLNLEDLKVLEDAVKRVKANEEELS